MRKFILFTSVWIICLSLFLTTEGCSEKKAAPDSIAADTIIKEDTTASDTIEELVSEAPMPKAADELFDDFFFYFAAASRSMQVKRIHFPLPEYGADNKAHYIDRKRWKADHFFMHQEFYTLILDNERQLNLVKDTAVANVIVEKITFTNSMVKQYFFKRMKGQWMLTSIHNKPVSANNNSSFLKFYERFVSDSTFQINNINDPLDFVGQDPDDEFSTVSGTIAPEQWPSFAPQIPKDVLYNINYGQKHTVSKKKIFVIRGISNGYETTLTFNHINGAWRLVKLNT